MRENQSTKRLKAGKLQPELLAEFLSGLDESSQRVLLGPEVGEDAAFVSFGSSTLIAKSDPVTFPTERIGWHVIQVNANDIAACGGTPKWFLATVLLPENEPASTAKAIFEQLRDAAAELRIALIGGHTEITVGLPRPIVAGTMLGEAAPSETLSTASAKPGEHVILTSGIAIEGTAIIAKESRNELLRKGLSETEIDDAANLIDVPGISIVRAAGIAASTGNVTAMHDATEGGLSGALDELTQASDTGVLVDDKKVVILPETRRICDALGLDPWGLIASGALLITADVKTSSDITSALADNGIESAVIGSITEPGAGLVRTVRGTNEPVPTFERDEIARLYSD
ncbi:MAG: AIR synthase family protein [Arenicellales bacterium]|nr:AIR synthase family protein [Arenicellales bacterium]